MPSISITISKPVIVAPTVFTVSYRLVGDVTWTLHGDEDNGAFTLTVPTDGDYEILVELAGCPDVIYGPVTILDAPPCDCPTVDTANITFIDIDATTTVLSIPFTGPLPADPPCGWLLVLRNKRRLTTIISTFATLPNPLERVVDRGDDYDYELRADCCAQVYNFCLQGTILSPVVIPQCIPIVLLDEGTPGGHIIKAVPGGLGYEILFKQSTPATLPAVTVVYFQAIGAPAPGLPAPDAGVIAVTPVPSGNPTYPWKVVFKVSPTIGYPFIYVISVRDNTCGGPDILWK